MWRRLLSWFIRVGAGLAILALLRHLGLLDLKTLLEAADHPELIAFAAIILLASIPIAAWRWWILLRGLDFPMNFRWTLRTVFIGQFSSAFLPGAHGGDLVRAALAYRATGGGLSRLSFSIIVDRLSGLVGLVLLGLGMVWTLPSGMRAMVLLPVSAAVVIMIAAVAVGHAFGRTIAALLERLPNPVGPKLAYVVREIVAALSVYLGRGWTLAAAVALSMLQFGLVLLPLPVLGAAMHFRGLTFTGYIFAGIWATIANAVPLTPGGLGIGEAAFANAASLLESTPSGATYATVFLAMRGLVFLTSVVGIVPYLPQRIQLRRDIASLDGLQVAERDTNL